MSDYNIYKNSFKSLYSFEWNKNLHYLDRYVKFISTRANIKITTKTAKHHILPRCMGGKNTKDNLVHLTHREHFIAHYMLAKAFPKHTIVHALARMTKTKSIKESKLYTQGIKLYIEHKREILKGHSLFEGRHFSDKTKHFFSLINSGENNPISKLTNDNIINIVKLYYIDGLSQLKISKIFSVGKTTIRNILLGKTWKTVTKFNTVNQNNKNYSKAIKLLKEYNKI